MSSLHRLHCVAVALGLPLALACDAAPSGASADGSPAATDVSSTADDVAASGPPAGSPTYWADVRPILAARCLPCHTAGETAPFRLDDYASASTYAAVALSAIERGAMPPWPAADDCRSYDGERHLGPGEQETLTAWLAGGTPEGDPTTDPASPASAETFVPTHTATLPEAYTPTQRDDWRCFVLDVDIPRESYLTALEVRPDQRAEVHHALVYAVDASWKPALDAAEAADAGPGYRCFGGPGPGDSSADGWSTGAFPSQLGLWVPGATATVLPEGTAIRVRKGSLIVIQLHYNTLHTAAAPDQTALNLRLVDETPTQLLSTTPLAIRSLAIAAGDADDVYTAAFANWNDHPVRLAGVMAHMHLIGSRFEVGLDAAGDAAAQCLLDLPDWDFNWQESYTFSDQDPVAIAPGQALRMTCAFDNSAANQPLLDGVQAPPRDVVWGESSLDEMCLLYVSHTEPFTPEPAEDQPACDATDPCLSACGSDVDCLMRCPGATRTCSACVLTSLKGCALECLAPLVLDPAAAACLQNCSMATLAFGGSTGRCFAEACSDAYTTALPCLQARLDDGACDDALAGCGL